LKRKASPSDPGSTCPASPSSPDAGKEGPQEEQASASASHENQDMSSSLLIMLYSADLLSIGYAMLSINAMYHAGDGGWIVENWCQG